MSRLAFDFPAFVNAGLPLLLAASIFFAWAQRKQGAQRARVVWSTALRGVVLLTMILLAARPVWIKPVSGERTSVLLLMDRSASMSLKEEGRSRFEDAVDFTRASLLPALSRADLMVRAFLFAEDAAEADGAGVAEAVPDGKRTDLSRAIAHALASAVEPPLAVIVLTDGATNVHGQDHHTARALFEAETPVLAVGFGSDSSVNTLSLQQAIAPRAVPRNEEFRISAQLEKNGTGELPPFDLLLLRNGQLHQHKTVSPGQGERLWLESFPVTEEGEGAFAYTLRIMPPQAEGLVCRDRLASVQVQITGEHAGRVLFAQGSPGWDYKFVRLAMRSDPAMSVTGLTRTSPQTFFRQNVERLGELAGGFPSTVKEIAPFRVVVLSNFRPADFSRAQQEMLVEYCSDFGGGVLIIGGAETFDASWADGPMENLLPVRFAPVSSPAATSHVFRLQLTEQALDHPVFQIGDGSANLRAWKSLPGFSRYARVQSTKLGATVWAENPTDRSADGHPRALIVHQRYGAGISMVICTPDFWSWRLSKGGDTREFDRFWRQLFRFLSEGSGAELVFHFPDQDLHPRSDLRVVVERRPDASNPDAARRYALRFMDSHHQTLREQSIEIVPGESLDVAFHIPSADVYTVEATDADRSPVASRSVDIRDTNIEYVRAARDMGMLRHWADLSGGAAVKAEECKHVDELILRVERAAEKNRQRENRARPAGMSTFILTLLLFCLCTEWVLRKRWRLL